MKILLWKISDTYEEEKNTIFPVKYFITFDDLTPYSHLIPDIDLKFYRIFGCKDDIYTYIVLDIYQIKPDLPNKNYIFPLLKQIYEIDIRKSKKKILNIQKDVCQNTELFQNQIYDNLYLHQIHNINWMEEIEKQSFFQILQKNWLLVTSNVAVNVQTFEMKYKKDVVENVTIPGGCLMDDYGMGKSRCMIKLCEKRKSVETIHPFHLNATLIICSHDLCLTWKDEILICNPQAIVKILATPSDQGDFTNVDYVVMSYKYFTDFHKTGYNEYWINKDLSTSMILMKKHCLAINKSTFQVTNFKWKRVIMDDIHEIFRLKQNDYFLNTIHQIEAEFKWAITGQQIFHSEALLNILKFITSNNDLSNLIRDSEYQFRLGKHFRKTEKGLQQYPIHEEIVTFNSREQNGYLKQRTKYDRQEYCLFPSMKLYSVDDIKKIFQHNEEMLKQKLVYETNETILQNLQQEINNSPVKFLHKNLENIQQRFCHICFTTIAPGNLSISRCGHHGCFECMIKSQEINKKCPFCRTWLSINDVYPIDDNLNDQYYGPKIRKLIADLEIKFLKTIVYVESHHITQLSSILEKEKIKFKVLKGSMRYKYNLVKQFDNFEEENFVLIITDPLVNYGIKNSTRIIILENWYNDTENKLKSFLNHLGHQNGFSTITQYLVNDTFETGV